MENNPSRQNSVYVIEDDPFLVKAYKFIFEKENLKMEQSLNGEDAVMYIESHEPPDIVLLDLMLPGISGFEVLEKIRANDRWKQVAVMIVSNLGEPQDVEKGKDLGAVDYMVKASVNLEDIVRSVKHYFHIG